MQTNELLAQLQCHGVRWPAAQNGLSRQGGAGPSDHKALSFGSRTMMVPILNQASQDSPYQAQPNADGSQALIFREGLQVGQVQMPGVPKFYGLSTADGIPVLEDRHATQQRCTRDHGAAALHPFQRSWQFLPVLRHRPVAGSGQDHRPQTPTAIGGSRQGRGRARWRQAHGDDHRHTTNPGPWRGDSCVSQPQR